MAKTANNQNTKEQLKPNRKLVTEEQILKSIGKKPGDKLTKRQHEEVAEIAKANAKAFRQADPKQAQQIYYIGFKHSRLAEAA